MGKIEKYKNIARYIISSTVDPERDEKVKHQAIYDEEGGNYLLFMNGWDGEYRFYGCLIHIEVKENGRVWVHQDHTDLVIVDQLLEAGIPHSDIVIGFHAPIMRPDTKFAVS